MTGSEKLPGLRGVALLAASLLWLNACALPQNSGFDPDTLPGEAQVRQQLASASLPPELVRQIPRLFRHEPLARAEAAAHIGRMGRRGAAAVPYLIRLLPDTTQVQLSNYLGGGYYTSTETTPGEEAARALAQIGPAASNSLLLVLKDSRPVVRRLAAKALGQIGELNAVEFLVDMLRDPNPGVRATVAVALGNYHNPMAAQKIMDAYPGASREVRTDLLYILGNINDVLAVPFLIEHARDPEPASRAAVMLVLGKIRDARGIPALLHGLRDADDATRANAAYALGGFYSPQVVEALIEALSDKAGSVREAAQRSLRILSGMNFAGDQGSWRQWWRQQLSEMQPKQPKP